MRLTFKCMSQQAAQIWTMMRHSKRFDGLVSKKVEFVSGGDGVAVCKFVVAPEHTNGYDTLHGGFTSSLIDQVSTLALTISEPHAPGVSVDLNVTFIRAAKLGEEVTVTAKLLKAGSSLGFLTVDLTDSNGSLVAQGRHTKFIGHQVSKE